jgi:hypothetical protein
MLRNHNLLIHMVIVCSFSSLAVFQMYCIVNWENVNILSFVMYEVIL